VQAILIRESTTVILAGYRDEIEDLLAYNVGFASRFPLEFAFEDYDQKQFRQILQTMVKDRGMQLERKRVCGVPVGDVVSRRIYQGAGKKGFGSARAARNKLDQIIASQSQRIGVLLGAILHNSAGLLIAIFYLYAFFCTCDLQ
jgi:predicted AAA+ superfamily ATPase